MAIRGLVSVVIPFYNAERFLQETIESAVVQSYKYWEILLVDDGSIDRSTEIARGYTSLFPDRISYLEHAGHLNRGVNCSRNLGAQSSRGEFLAFLDSDDIWMPGKLESQVELMQQHQEAGFLFERTEYWYDWDPEWDGKQKNHVPPLAPGGKLYTPPLLLARSYPLGPYGAPCPSSFLVRRNAFDRVGGFDESFNPSTFQQYEDIAFLAKVYLTTPVFVSDACLDRNRCSRFSMTHHLAGTNQEEAARRFYFKWLKQYLKLHGVVDQEIWSAVCKQDWYYWLPLPVAVAKLMRRIVNKILRATAPKAASGTQTSL